MITNTWRRFEADDTGLGMVLVIGTMVVVMLLSAVSFTVVQEAMSSSTAHNRFEVSLDVAESGIDMTLANLQADSTYTRCGCSAPSSFGSDAAERAWARQQIAAFAASSPSSIKTTAQGQYLAIRPANRQTVYAMSWVPSFANPKKSRLLKAEYVFAPYKPTNAILTKGDLLFSGSVLVNNADASATAPVHSNGSIESNNSSLQVVGDVTSSGGYDVSGNASVGAGSGGNTPLQAVPTVSARYYFDNLSTTYGGPIESTGYTGSWYDLCPDGLVHARDTGTTPCSGTAVSTAGVTFRGWDFSPATSTTPVTWTMNESSSPYDGIYYVYRGDAVINGKTHSTDPPWHTTVLAESTQSDACSRTDGDISWKLTDIANFIPGTVLLADRNFYDSANNDAGNGMFAAGNQIYMSTSSANLTGYIVAGDECPNPNNPSTIQGVTIKFDQTGEAPVQSIIRTTLWLEYVG